MNKGMKVGIIVILAGFGALVIATIFIGLVAGLAAFGDIISNVTLSESLVAKVQDPPYFYYIAIPAIVLVGLGVVIFFTSMHLEDKEN